MFRCAKNSNHVIIVIGNDQGQSGHYPSVGPTLGTWCTWTIAETDLPALSAIEDAPIGAMRFKENDAGDGIDLRTDSEVLANPNG